MEPDKHSPCIIGVAQRTVRPHERPSPEPLALWEDVVRSATADAQAQADVLGAVESLSVAHCLSWSYDEPVYRLANRLGIDPVPRMENGPAAGVSCQLMLQRAAEAIITQSLDVAVVCGGEAMRTVRDYAKGGETPPWSYPGDAGTRMYARSGRRRDDAERAMESALELRPAAGRFGGGNGFSLALWDNARRAHIGVPLDDYRRQLGELLAGQTKVAVHNPYAWFPEERTADFLITPRPDNRMVTYPYTKHMMSIIDVDMAAAVVIASHEAADRLGVPTEKRIYLHGWCYARDPLQIGQREDLWKSVAMEAASRETTRCAGITVGEIKHIDLYSCFTSSVNLARDALGAHGRGGDELTVTGGLAYNGGPASSYTAHSIATMVERLRQDPGEYGLVSGMGGPFVHHTFGLFNATPKPGSPPMPDQRSAQDAVDRIATRNVVNQYNGPASVVGFTVGHDGAGDPVSGAAVCDLPDGARAYAYFDDPDTVHEFEKHEMVGQQVKLSSDQSGANLLHL